MGTQILLGFGPFFVVEIALLKSDQILMSLGISSFRDCILLGLCWWSNLAWMKLHAYFSAFKNSLVLLLLCQLHCSTGDAGGRDTLPGIFSVLSRTPQSPFGFLLFTYEELLDIMSFPAPSFTQDKCDHWNLNIYSFLCQKRCNSWEKHIRNICWFKDFRYNNFKLISCSLCFMKGREGPGTENNLWSHHLLMSFNWSCSFCISPTWKIQKWLQSECS